MPIRNVEIFEDKTARLSIEEINRLPPEAWHPAGPGVARFGYTTSRWWLRFRIGEFETPSTARYLDVPYSYLFRLGFYIFDHGKFRYHSEAGLSVPFHARDATDIKTGAYAFRWTVEPGDDFQYYLSAEGAFPLALPFTVWPGGDYVSYHGDRQLVLGIFFGGLFFAILFNTVLAIALRSRLYAYYASFVFFMSALAFSHEGLSALYLWPDAGWWAERDMHLSGGLAVLSYALFVAEFLRTRRNAPWLHRLLFLLVAISGVRTAWAFFVGDNLTVYAVGEFAIILLSPLTLLIALICARRGVRSAKIFFFSSFAYNAGFCAFLLQLTNAVELGPLVDYAPHAGLLAEVLLLSLALADRIRRTNAELVQTNQRLDLEIRERERAERALEAERRETVHAEKLRALGRMAAGIAHEINNPLAIIHGNAALLKGMTERGEVDMPGLHRISTTVEKTTERISRIVKSMRALSRDSRQDPFARCSVWVILQDAQAITEERFRAGGIALEFRPPAEDVALLCRSAEIVQVLVNLLGNAFDAVEGSVGWTKVETRDAGNAIEFAVTDSGPGIPAEYREHVQEPFFTTKEVGRGTGLGLSISRSIVAAHGGNLRIDEASERTRFVFTIPKALV